MACEDSLVSDSDDDSVEIEEATSQPIPGATKRQPPIPAAATDLSHAVKKKQAKRVHDLTKHRATTINALNGTTAPIPTPHILEKAAQSVPINVAFSADDFRATQQWWTSLAGPANHPLCAYANEPKVLKAHMQYVGWQGEKCHVILDRTQHIIGVLISPPEPGETWASVVAAATAAICAARDKMTFPAGAYHHRRASGEGFPTGAKGFAFSSGRQTVRNIKASFIACMATYPIPGFQSLCYPIYKSYHEMKQILLKKNPSLHCTWVHSPFTAFTTNLGPFSVSPPHVDHTNKADGMCLIGALVNSTPTRAGTSSAGIMTSSSVSRPAAAF
ncbi:hypothetical protein DFH08DRAFT_949360 [Mycena albidolilacea]|uniref:Uncharacterized protein n=1 Tax=Mycena albidolilacea TaxID=1033008 RepID=A0AAD7F107_9AGAR|nr:hypothetical protein DFH08DRAFT_949360 [Mycena albidolilacea]